MSDESKALVPIEEKQVEFYGDELTAVLVDTAAGQRVYVPVKPLADALGLAWSGQYERLQRDEVLAEESQLIRVTRIKPERGNPDILCLPLEFIPGWLFGINAARVRPELREKITRYRRECYRVLWEAFQTVRRAADVSPSVSALVQIREMGLAIAEMASQQIEYEQRIVTTETRLDKAAVVVGQIQSRLTAVERKLSPGNPITDEQAQEVQAAVQGLAMLLTEKDSSKNHFQGIFNELHRRFGVTSYKLIPQAKYPAVLTFLEEWRGRANQ